jgi:hypothetical protein
MWNLLVAGFVFGHASMAALLRELSRNIQLAHMCGFAFGKLPSAWNMSRFIDNLLKREAEVLRMFESLSECLYASMEGFGKDLAIDSKWLPSAASRASKRKAPDGRSEADARKGIKAYSGVSEDGSRWQKTLSCFGFKVHLLADAYYELPVAYEVTDAAASDIAEGKKMVKKLKGGRPDVLDTCGHLMADRGYDDGALIGMLKESGIKAVIAKRAMWKAEAEKEVPGHEGAWYDEAGNGYGYTKEKGIRSRMAPNGYEKGRDALRFRCPAQEYGIGCPEVAACRCRSVRVPLSTDPRVFTQVQRETGKWERLYSKRTSVERVNSRLDGAYGFEQRRTRGLARMRLHVGLALLVMLATAAWKAGHGREGAVRSLVKAA